jgi:hypothetical protein
MVKVSVASPALSLDAATLWHVRTSSLFMSCERAVFGDLNSQLVMYERNATGTRARYVVQTTPDVTLPYVVRRALGVAGGKATPVITFDDFEVDEAQSTAPYLFEAALRTYTTFLNPSNSVIKGLVRCKSVDAQSCELSLKLEFAIKTSVSSVGSAVEKQMVSKIKTKFSLYPRVVELYKQKLVEIEMRKESRALDSAPANIHNEDEDEDEFHSVYSVVADVDDDENEAPNQKQVIAIFSGENTDSNFVQQCGNAFPHRPYTEVGPVIPCCVPLRRRASREAQRASRIH